MDSELHKTSPSTATASAPTETRDLILDAALTQFDRFGPTKTTMNDIACAAGLARATLYLHFPNKKALYTAALERATHSLVAACEALMDQPLSSQRKLRRFVELTTEIYTANRVFLSAVIDEPNFVLRDVADNALKAHRQKQISFLRAILDQGVVAREFRRIDTEKVAELMHELGILLVVKEVTGTGEHPLSEMLRVMDDVFALGITGDLGYRPESSER
ncbi:MAG: TetR/AcrR family transcriptional regulator [Pseudomonadales bacterium]|nr:TetR/AcrR family transcriptional regulator [Pseudomonadales bacterium]MDP6829132.1 TetR/AcrR family transcriptional regulator [Pseudomonadales bacterium]